MTEEANKSQDEDVETQDSSETVEAEEATPEESTESEDKGSSDNKDMHKATCGDCGSECEVPFKPEAGRDVFCKDCYQKRRPKRSFNSNRGGGGRFGGGRQQQQRRMHKATCGKCKKACEVPFRPTEGKPVLCRDCYEKSKSAA